MPLAVISVSGQITKRCTAKSHNISENDHFFDKTHTFKFRYFSFSRVNDKFTSQRNVFHFHTG
ncbi:hypothetical protein EDWATA_03873 [Edwardsiella tarda ATCC 23685]|uniref:Uncharacterized protein n=1 Tax=Edwardsiella tarda ATCC 23685 TaxID=500638 RepID=D4FAQ2_EDWTA|nr:hypothetical protein EDWATA_03873 [Edwardsiella tarda ATCC 23685]